VHELHSRDWFKEIADEANDRKSGHLRERWLEYIANTIYPEMESLSRDGKYSINILPGINYAPERTDIDGAHEIVKIMRELEFDTTILEVNARTPGGLIWSLIRIMWGDHDKEGKQ
jgi:hypothetical protein